MIDLRECMTLDVMPEVLRKDLRIQAASYALQKTACMLIKKIDRTSTYAELKLLPESIVDLLAVEFRAKYYGDGLSLEEKKSAVEKALLWYCRAGTPSAVQELTDFVFQDAHLEEWFRYGSGAFLFRVIVNVISQDMPLEKYLKYLKALYEVKNTRSHLEAVIFIYHQEISVKAVAAAGIGNSIKIKTRTARKIGADVEDKNAAALFLNQNIRVRADNSIKENEVYLLAGDGKKERVFAGNGRIVKAARKEGG